MPARIPFTIPVPPRPSADFARDVPGAISDPLEGGERRAHERRSLSAVVRAVEVDEDYHPIGEEFTLHIRDISSGGISFIDTRSLSAKLIIVELPMADTDDVQVVVEILRCRAVDRFYDIGGKFVARLG